MIYQNNADSAIGQNHSTFPHDGQFSSMELLWKSAFQELDSWSELADHYDQVLLNAAKKYVERVNQGTENMKAITEQFNRELQEWEGTAREELLMTTTTIKQLFPKKSYHDINLVFDEIHNKLTNIALTPINALTSTNAVGKYIQATEQMVELRKKGREQYIEKMKQIASILYGNQKLFFDMLEKQFKTAMFPLQKYMEKSGNLRKYNF
ncbi:hypothetical protein [Bacillus sp. T3]|uniref:hypothetical protein n=1 Tax=Bacillus sp. T3 TaxID=467262 RepID=UPI00298239D1|nr:hypothetical protein [Bacillus sp. T3]